MLTTVSNRALLLYLNPLHPPPPIMAHPSIHFTHTKTLKQFFNWKKNIFKGLSPNLKHTKDQKNWTLLDNVCQLNWCANLSVIKKAKLSLKSPPVEFLKMDVKFVARFGALASLTARTTQTNNGRSTFTWLDLKRKKCQIIISFNLKIPILPND